MSETVLIREVGPRDGFQNEPEVIATDDKVMLVEGLARTGLRRLEVTSFVRADVIPQLADGAEVLRRADIPDDVSVSVLIPNEKGLDNALAQRDRFQEINCFLSATESQPGEVEVPRNAQSNAQSRPRDLSSGPRFGRGGPTSREREVLALLAAGATDEQIAEMLELSPATVQTHVRNAKAKLGARTRAQAVAMALQNGMINLT